jgi:hypothetical protein
LALLYCLVLALLYCLVFYITLLNTFFPTWKSLHTYIYSAFFVCLDENRLSTRMQLVEQELLYPSGEPDFTPIFSWVRATPSIVLCKVFSRSLVVLLSFFYIIQVKKQQ